MVKVSTLDIKISVLGDVNTISLHKRSKRGWGRRVYRTELRDGERLEQGVVRAYEEYAAELAQQEGG